MTQGSGSQYGVPARQRSSLKKQDLLLTEISARQEQSRWKRLNVAFRGAKGDYVGKLFLNSALPTAPAASAASPSARPV
jgi:hypothetical protein